MNISSPSFDHGNQMPSKYTCDGEGINPTIMWSDVPEETQSFALIIEDPDVPKHANTHGVWDHWVIWNIPPQKRFIMEGESPEGIYGITTDGDTIYVSPCPPDGKHRYFFRLYALDKMIDLPPRSTKKDLILAIKNHMLAQAELIGTYQRQN